MKSLLIAITISLIAVGLATSASGQSGSGPAAQPTTATADALPSPSAAQPLILKKDGGTIECKAGYTKVVCDIQWACCKGNRGYCNNGMPTCPDG